MKAIDEEMTEIMKNVSVVRQKRTHADREQSKKKRKLTLEQVMIEDDTNNYVK